MNQDDANLITELFNEKVKLNEQIQALTKERDGLRENLREVQEVLTYVSSNPHHSHINKSMSDNMHYKITKILNEQF